MADTTGSILLRRGPTVDREAFCPLVGEIIYDTDQKQVFIGDSTSFGGVTVFNNKVILGADGKLTVTNLNEPLVDSDAATKFYVDTYINQGFAGEGVLYKSGVQGEFSTISSKAFSEWPYYFLSFNSSTQTYGFKALPDTGAAITLLKVSGARGITVKAATTDIAGTESNPTITDKSYLTIDVDVNTLRQTLNIDNVTNSSTTTILTDTTLTGNTTLASLNVTGGSKLQGATEMLSTLKVDGSVGTNGQFLSSTGSGLRWVTLSANSISNGTSSVVVQPSGNVNITVGGTLVGAFDSTGLVGNASSVTDGVYTTGSYSKPSWITALDITQGGTNATNKIDALTNLLPTGETSGYVLKTTGRGNYYWGAAGDGGAGAVGTTVSTTRQQFLATNNQTLFTLTSGTYTPGAGQLRVYIAGVRQFNDAYDETSISSFTLNVGLSAGTPVLAEIDGYTSFTINASNVISSPVGSLAASDVQSALEELETEKAPLSNPTFSGTTEVANFKVTTGGTVTGLTKAMVGLSNVTNESKATMFTTSTFTLVTKMTSLGVGTSINTTTPTAIADGEIRAKNNVTAYYSDDRLKTRLGTIENALDKIDQLTGFYYEENELAISLGYNKKRQVGLSAQSMQKVLPEIVTGAPVDPENYLTIWYEKTAPLLVEGIKELRREINAIKNHLGM